VSHQPNRRTETGKVQPDELAVATQPIQPAGGPPGRAPSPGLLANAAGSFLANDRLVLLALLALAALVRLPFLDARGSWDSDQGHDMLVLRALVRDGQIPLLGPPTSIGDFHHGALYYFLLAPAAFLSGAQPFAVVLELALLGIAAVPVVWWLARSIGGPATGRIAGLVAGLLIAVSPSAIETSTFIWNPNPIPLFAALAYASAWRARQTGRAQWWAAAVICAGVVTQLHVLGVIFLIAIVVAAFVTPGRGAPRAASARSVAVGLVVVAITYLPLLAYELGHGWEETRNVIAFFTGGGRSGASLDPVSRLVFTTLRAVGWPLVGLVTDVPFAAIASVAVAIALAAWRARAGVGDERFAARWLGATVLVGIVGLTILAPSLATVVEGLPNDHYHAFLDPAVFVLVGLGVGALVAGRPAALPASPRTPATPRVARPAGTREAPLIVDRTARGLVLLGLIALVAVDVGQWPPRVASDGGYPAAERAAAQILDRIDGRTITLAGLPTFKTTEGVEFPLRVLGAELVPAADAGALVVVCDRLFEPVMHETCGGDAEAKIVGTSERFVQLLDRFPLSKRTEISIYMPRG
jgi:4-amino-4-deoxy-L-arabinose transferase-like glycosyltransferase